jgi:toxin ParE1/3/4
MRVRISGKARTDLLAIYSYLAERNPLAAENVVEEINSKFRQLSHFPFMGRSRPEFLPSVRSALVGSYLVLYRVEDDDHIIVMRVIHGRMDVDKEFRR